MSGSNENVIEFLRDQKKATVTFCQGKYISKIRKLAEKYPDECDIDVENTDGSIVAHIPVKWIKITPLKREITDEQKQILRDRMQKLREDKRI